MRTMKPERPVAIDRIVPSTAGRKRIETRVWMRPIGVGHMVGSRELFCFLDLADGLRRLVREAQLHREARREAAPRRRLGAAAVARDATREVREASDRVAGRDDRAR